MVFSAKRQYWSIFEAFSTIWLKICFYCKSRNTQKYGRIGGVQRYKCNQCGKQFLANNRLSNNEIWQLYTEGKQTYNQLGAKFGCSAKTIQRHIDKIQVERSRHFEAAVNVLMDTTYFGRTFGVMVFKDSITGKFLLKKYVKQETNKLYKEGIEEICRRGISVQAIICDGRKGLLGLFGNIPMQMCQFHQIATITRYLTRKPKIPAGIELRALSLRLTKNNKTDFSSQLDAWYNKWDSFLKERTKSITTGKTYYTHKRLRSAYFSLKRNLQWLFTFEDYRDLMIPNTTNALDGAFSNLKNKLRNHNGLSLERKKKFIDAFFEV